MHRLIAHPGVSKEQGTPPVGGWSFDIALPLFLPNHPVSEMTLQDDIASASSSPDPQLLLVPDLRPVAAAIEAMEGASSTLVKGGAVYAKLNLGTLVREEGENEGLWGLEKCDTVTTWRQKP